MALKDSEYDISERLINEYGQQLSDKEKYEEAILFYKLNLELYPPGFYTHRTLDYYGDCLLKLGKRKEAIKLFENSLELNPENSKTRKALLELKSGK